VKRLVSPPAIKDVRATKQGKSNANGYFMADILTFCRQLGLDPKKVAATHGGEYKSPCPKCDGTDRFIVWPNRQYPKCIGGYFCRQCDKGGDCIAFCREFLGMTWEQAVAASHATVTFDRQQDFQRPKQPQHRSTTAPSRTWQDMAGRLVCMASDQIKSRPYVLEELENRGIPLEAVEKFHIGYIDNPKDHYGAYQIPRSEFGLLQDLKEDGKPRDVWVPRGVLIPSIEPSGKVVRLKVRLADHIPGSSQPKYVAITGSMDGLILIGDRNHDSIVVVESELDGYAASHAVGDVALVIAIGGNTKNLDAWTNLLVTESKTLLICHDNDEGGRTMMAKWQQLYPKAIPCPTPHHKDIGDAIKSGVDIRAWLLDALSKHESP